MSSHYLNPKQNKTKQQAKIYCIIQWGNIWKQHINTRMSSYRGEEMKFVKQERSRLWKHFRLLKQHFLWYNCARRGWMISLPDMLWGYTGSLGMPEWQKMKSPTSSQEAVLFSGLLDLSLSWGVSRQNIRRNMKRWMEKLHLALWHGPCSTERLESWYLALIWLQRPECGTEEETSVHILCAWGLGLTQVYIYGFLLFGPWGH